MCVRVLRSHEPVAEALCNYLGSEQNAPFPSRYMVFCRHYSWRRANSTKFRIKWRDIPFPRCIWSLGLILCRSQAPSLTSPTTLDAQFGTVSFPGFIVGRLSTWDWNLVWVPSSPWPGELWETCPDQRQRKWTRGPVLLGGRAQCNQKWGHASGSPSARISPPALPTPVNFAKKIPALLRKEACWCVCPTYWKKLFLWGKIIH